MEALFLDLNVVVVLVSLEMEHLRYEAVGRGVKIFFSMKEGKLSTSHTRRNMRLLQVGTETHDFLIQSLVIPMYSEVFRTYTKKPKLSFLIPFWII